MIVIDDYISFDCYGLFLVEENEPTHPVGIYDTKHKAINAFNKLTLTKKTIIDLQFYYKINEYPRDQDIVLVVIQGHLDNKLQRIQLEPIYVTSDAMIMNVENTLFSKFNADFESLKKYQHAYLDIHEKVMWQDNHISLN